MATFKETRAPTSREYVAEQGIVIPNWSKIIQTFRLHSSVFAKEKLRENLIDPLVATFSETCAPTSKKYVAKQGIVMPNWSKTFQTFWSYYSVFDWEKQPKNLNIQSSFTSNSPSGGSFQRNACTDFQKICSWTRYSDATLIKIISKFFVALHFLL